MSQTYTQRYTHGGSLAMVELIGLRGGEDPTFVDADDNGNELYIFPDNSLVLMTNAGIVSEADTGFDEAMGTILHNAGERPY